jgi:hypothetical protein
VVGGFAWGTKGGEGPNEDAEEGEGESEGKSKREGEPLLRIREEAMRVNIPRAFAYYGLVSDEFGATDEGHVRRAERGIFDIDVRE